MKDLIWKKTLILIRNQEINDINAFRRQCLEAFFRRIESYFSGNSKEE